MLEIIKSHTLILNFLTYRIPLEIQSLLASFPVIENLLIEIIPSSILNSLGLVELSLYRNSLIGIILPKLGKLSSLTFLYL